MSLSKSRKRSYRYRVKCEECEKEFDSDYVEAHSRIVNSGRKVKCLPVVESSQLKLSGFFSKSSAAVESPGQTQEAPLVGCSPESEQRTISSTYESVANIQPDPESIDQDSLRRIQWDKTDLAVSPLLTLKECMQTRQCRMTCKGLLTYLGVEVIVLHTSFRAQMGTFYLSLHGFVF